MDRREAARRVEQFERSLDPRSLWPDVTEQEFVAALGEVVRVASARLAAAPTQVAVRDPVPGGLGAFGVAAFASGLGPLLGYWVERGDLEASPAVASLLREHLDHGRRRAARLRIELERLVRLFDGAGIEVTVLKGMHTGWAYFPDPGTRPASDIDLLIRPDRAAATRRLLAQQGFTAVAEMPQRSTWKPPGDALLASLRLTHADNPWSLDLHVSLDRLFFGPGAMARFDLEDEDLRSWQVSDQNVRVLSQPLLVCFLSVHATNHFPYITPLRLVELALVFQRDAGPALAWDRLLERLARSDSRPYAYPALKLTADLVPGVVDPALLAVLRESAPADVRSLVDRLTPATSLQLYRRSFEGHFLWAGSGWERFLGLVRWLWPRDGIGGRLPLLEAVRVTGRRLRRLATGRLSWRVR